MALSLAEELGEAFDTAPWPGITPTPVSLADELDLGLKKDETHGLPPPGALSYNTSTPSKGIRRGKSSTSTYFTAPSAPTSPTSHSVQEDTLRDTGSSADECEHEFETESESESLPWDTELGRAGGVLSQIGDDDDDDDGLDGILDHIDWTDRIISLIRGYDAPRPLPPQSDKAKAKVVGPGHRLEGIAERYLALLVRIQSSSNDQEQHLPSSSSITKDSSAVTPFEMSQTLGVSSAQITEYIQRILEGLHLQSSLFTSTSRQLRNIRSNLDAYKEREQLESDARATIIAWERERVEYGLEREDHRSGVKEAAEECCAIFENVLESAQAQMTAVRDRYLEKEMEILKGRTMTALTC